MKEQMVSEAKGQTKKAFERERSGIVVKIDATMKTKRPQGQCGETCR
jgi:hypothetical protein